MVHFERVEFWHRTGSHARWSELDEEHYVAAHKETRFRELVTLAFSADQEEARTLWVPLAQQFDREGPEAAKEYLAAQRQQLTDQVEKLLGHVEEQIDG